MGALSRLPVAFPVGNMAVSFCFQVVAQESLSLTHWQSHHSPGTLKSLPLTVSQVSLSQILSPTLDEWSVDAGSFRCIARHLRITRDGGTYYAPGANHPILSRPPPASMCCTACRTRCCSFPIARQALSRFWSRARGGRKGGRAAKAGSCSSLPAPTY